MRVLRRARLTTLTVLTCTGRGTTASGITKKRFYILNLCVCVQSLLVVVVVANRLSCVCLEDMGL